MDKKLRIHYFQHVPYEGPGCIEIWANQMNHQFTATRFYLNETPPPIFEIDWLLVMGGPMGIYDEDEYPWLLIEKDYIKEAIKREKVVIGICLGAQLLADALGAKVIKGEHKEIGWHQIKKSTDGQSSFLLSEMPDEFMVFHWHGDQFEIPKGAKCLAESKACSNQLFSFGEKVLGLQFHFEATEASIQEMLIHGQNELVESKFVQSDATIRSGLSNCSKANKVIFSILDRLEQCWLANIGHLPL